MLALLVATCLGQPYDLSSPATGSIAGSADGYVVGKRIVLYAVPPKDLTESVSRVVNWDLPEGLEEEEEGLKLCLWGLAGQYRIKCAFFFVDDKGVIHKRKVPPATITIRNPGTPVGPGPVQPVRPDPGEPAVPKPEDRVGVVVYESLEGSLPLQVEKARSELIKAGMQLRAVDRDVVTGRGQVPTGIRAAIEEARKLGRYPALVVLRRADATVYLDAVALPCDSAAIVERCLGS